MVCVRAHGSGGREVNVVEARLITIARENAKKAKEMEVVITLCTNFLTSALA